jgi:hypothetical protein
MTVRNGFRFLTSPWFPLTSLSLVVALQVVCLVVAVRAVIGLQRELLAVVLLLSRF